MRPPLLGGRHVRGQSRIDDGTNGLERPIIEALYAGCSLVAEQTVAVVAAVQSKDSAVDARTRTTSPGLAGLPPAIQRANGGTGVAEARL